MSDSTSFTSSNAQTVNGSSSPSGATNGRYVYCFLDGETAGNQVFCNGINNLPVRTISFCGVTSVVSDIVYKQMDSNLEHVMAHQRVVEEARKSGFVVLPVRFGVIINGDNGVRKLLQTSAPKYKQKMAQLYQKDEFGVKVILNKEDVAKFSRTIELESKNVQKLKDEVASCNPGRAYFLKMKLQDAIKTETLRKIEEISKTINRELSEVAQDTAMLKSDVSQVILNASYLVDRSGIALFEQKVAELTQRFAEQGLNIHKSGPWAPYSFC